MHRNKRNLSQDYESTFRSSFDNPFIFVSAQKIPTFQDVVAPFVRKKSEFFTVRKKVADNHAQDFMSDRKKIEKFLIEKKVKKQEKLLMMSRDISHLKDKVTNSGFKEKTQNLQHSQEVKVHPNIKELGEIGRNPCSFFPKILQTKVTEGENSSNKIGKDWITSKNSKFVYGRQDIENLKIWFNETKEKLGFPHISSSCLNEVKGFLLVTLKELHSQLVFHCSDQAEILLEMFQFYSKVIDKYSKINYSMEKVRISKNFEEVQTQLKEKVVNLKKKINELQNEKNEISKKYEEVIEKVKKLEEDLNFQREFLKNPIRRRTSISVNNANYDLNRFAENLKKKYGEIGGMYDNIAELKPKHPNIRITTFESDDSDPSKSNISFSSVSSQY
jgi:hypothetical protein